MSTIDAPNSTEVDLLGVPWLDTDGRMLQLCREATTHPAVASRTLSFIVEPIGSVVVRLDILSASHRVSVARTSPAPSRRSAGPASADESKWDVNETVACSQHATAPPTDCGLLPPQQTWRAAPWELDFESDLSFGHSAVSEAARLIEDLDGDANVLVGRFPGHPSALTALRVEPAATHLGWRSWHLYPGSEPHLVATQTTATPSIAALAQRREEFL